MSLIWGVLIKKDTKRIFVFCSVFPEASPTLLWKMNLALMGSREFRDQAMFQKEIEYIVGMWGRPNQVLTGGCRGADTMAE